MKNQELLRREYQQKQFELLQKPVTLQTPALRKPFFPPTLDPET
jgi:hypothetical protein